jgi:hypothetical protein
MFGRLLRKITARRERRPEAETEAERREAQQARYEAERRMAEQRQFIPPDRQGR